jgi:1-deoxy-D-xylulose-5-phosphate synthase
MAVSRDCHQDDHHVLAVVGDGSLTSGIALEGLNQAGHLKRNLIVILNDNEMSISPNVGALSGYLNKIITGQTYNKLRQEVESVLHAIPAIGSQMIKAAKIFEELFKKLFVPGMLFEELGFKYIGPLRGHNLKTLIRELSEIKKMAGPVLVHVVTKKGKGYPPAENNAPLFHGSQPFDIDKGRFIASKDARPSYTSIFGKTILNMARKDKRVVCITAAMREGTGLAKFAETLPEQFFDVGIAEQHAVTFAAGMALDGYKPVVAIYSTFLQRAYDQVLHDVCLMDIPVLFILDRGGLVADGPTHHGVLDMAYLRSLPNMVVMAPKDENELCRMINTALQIPHPVAIRYPKAEVEGVRMDKQPRTIKFGRGEILKEGDCGTLMAIGSMVHPALRAAEELEKKGWRFSVLNSRFLKPLDRDLILRTLRKSPVLITLEEHTLSGGFGSAVLEILEEAGMSAVRTYRIGIPDIVTTHGSRKSLLRLYNIDVEGIVQQVSNFMTACSLYPGTEEEASRQSFPVKMITKK